MILPLLKPYREELHYNNRRNGPYMNSLVYIIVFAISSFGSFWIMRKRGYPLPKGAKSKIDRILIVMHLLWFIILNLLGFSLILFFSE